MAYPKTGSEDTRSRILEAALDLFSKNGFHATTTRKIAVKADVNEVTLFRLFKNKMALFQEVLNEIKKIGFDADRVDEFDFAPEEAIQLIVEGVFETLENNPREIRLINLAILNGVEGFEKGFVTESMCKALIFISDVFRKLQNQHKITSTESPEILAQLLLIQAVEVATQRILRDYSPLRQYDRASLCNAIVRLFMA